MTSINGDWKKMSKEEKRIISEGNKMLPPPCIKPNPLIELWTADELADCLPYQQFLTKEKSDALYRKLRDIVNGANKSTPVGGDGTGNTVESPEERLTTQMTTR